MSQQNYYISGNIKDNSRQPGVSVIYGSGCIALEADRKRKTTAYLPLLALELAAMILGVMDIFGLFHKEYFIVLVNKYGERYEKHLS